MDIIQFVQELEAAERSEAVDRWAAHLREALAEQTFFFARYAEDVDEKLRVEYVELLESILNELPDDVPVVVSSSLFRYLKQLLPTEHHDELAQKVKPSSRVPV